MTAAHATDRAVVRPAPSHVALPSLAEHARWLPRYAPPFEFGDFFSPEDTVLCAAAAAWALARAESAGRPAERLVELTAGGALVTFAQLDRGPALRAWGADVDDEAVDRARRNARVLGLTDRARFRRLGIFDRRIVHWLRRIGPDVVACNPPYIPEPPDQPLALVAGAGADGAAHPRRTIAACARAAVPRLVLSWCSLGDPVGVARAAARRGYVLESLWASAIADGEWAGMAHGYARTLPTAFLREDAPTLRALAPDGAARFAYLLLAASFARTDAPGAAGTGATEFDAARRAGVRAVSRVVRGFARGGLAGLASAAASAERGGLPVHASAADRWDEILLRAAAHGPAITRPRA